MKTIPVKNGKPTLVDDQDYEALAAFKWYAHTCGYAMRRTFGCGQHRTIYMHRVILNAPAGMQVDHINGVTYDNRRSNLRLVTKSQNQHNLQAPIKSSTGVRNVFEDPGGWYRVRFRINNVYRTFAKTQDLEEAKRVAAAVRASIFAEPAPKGGTQ